MGFSVATTVLAGAATLDLADLLTIKDELSLSASNTANDRWLGRTITQMSQSIASHTRRVFHPELVQDLFDIQQDPYPYQTPGGFAQLQLSRWPVLAVLSVTLATAPGAIQDLIEGKHFRTDAATGLLLRLDPYTGAVTTWDAMPITVQYVGGFGALVEEGVEVPAQAPFKVTVAQSAAFSCDQAVSDPETGPLVRVKALPGKGQYAVAGGIYTFSADDAGRALSISYAVAQIPADLVDICLRLVTGRYQAKGRDPTLIQRDTPGVGTERFWFGSAPGQKGAFPPDISAALDLYSMPVVI